MLAERYASKAINYIWSPEGKVVLERDLWIAVLKAQKELGIEIPEGVIESYEAVAHTVDLESIKRRECVTRHDVKARIEEFCELAGAEHIHKGMTSRDLTENVEQLQIHRSLEEIQLKTVNALKKLATLAKKYRSQKLTARTHNVPAQITTLGKRISIFGEELLHALNRLAAHKEAYAFRGIVGAVGTQIDQAALLHGDYKKVKALNEAILKHLGATRAVGSVGQVYPRSLDFETVSTLYQLACAPASFSLTLRLMAGHELGSEGFSKGQSGSSAMPHKMNSRSCERIEGLKNVLQGYVTMAAATAGNQWNEGDVSCSSARRIFLPDSFFTIDGILETFLTILNQLEFYEQALDKEVEHYLPFLATTQILMASVGKGVGRESAHAIIKKHAVVVLSEMRSGKSSSISFSERLAGEKDLKLSQKEIDSIIDHTRESVGSAESDVDNFINEVEVWTQKFPEYSKFEPAAIL